MELVRRGHCVGISVVAGWCLRVVAGYLEACLLASSSTHPSSEADCTPVSDDGRTLRRRGRAAVVPPEKECPPTVAGRLVPLSGRRQERQGFHERDHILLSDR